jgi:tetratricopeptide (TPR) repeat protein
MHNTVNEEWRVHLALGDLHLEREDTEKAKDRFRKAISLTPNPSECHKIVGNFYFARASWELAEKHFKSAILKNSDYPDAWLGLARVYKSVKKDNEYRDCTDRLKALESGDIEILKEIGIYDLRFGRFKSAIGYFKRILEQMPDDLDAHINLALAYKYEGMAEDAERHNLRALELRGDSVEALSNLGHLYYEATRFDKAKEMYVRAIQLQENLVDIHVRLANICLLDGEIEKCVEACDNVLRELSLPRSKTLHDIQDLAGLFFLIGWGLKQAGKNKLSQEAGQTGNLLRQIQGEQSSAWGIKKDSKLQQFPI